jgi:multiple sugar transport system permease protein
VSLIAKPAPADDGAARARTKRKRPGPLVRRRRRAGVLFALPVLAVLGPLMFYPVGQTIYHSFTNWDGITSQWIGTDGYSQLFHNPEFVQVLENNARMIVAVPVAIVASLGVAFLINGRPRGWKFFRSIFFLPTAVSWVVIGYISVSFFQNYGILQDALGKVGLGFLHPNLLSHQGGALVAVMLTFIWALFGVNLIIFLAGMATIDQEIYDAAKIDGASSMTVMWRITLPLLRRFIQFALIFSLITEFSALFSLIYIMTGGGPAFGTTTLEFFVYEQAFSEGNFGAAATAGVVLFAIIFTISMIQFRVLAGDE